ncbi:MAG: 50S ribosomal protein L17 [Patescibacteria group bacterium]|nr:50S ribosomal protein L17 [Patescibacteria group bacterium]MDD5490498.1 50S ribosomal protein L17 [Patescibacteria group bacterium]
MRHLKRGKILDRAKAARGALLRSLATSFILYEKIKTTEAKAKALRPFVEKLITKGKRNNLTVRRELLSILYTESAVKKILEDLAPRYKDRKGGYTRITKIIPRKGDGARMAKIEFV